jgi:hypothetical protein
LLFILKLVNFEIVLESCVVISISFLTKSALLFRLGGASDKKKFILFAKFFKMKSALWEESQYKLHMMSKESKENKSEVRKYLAEPCEDDNSSFDILLWWKDILLDNNYFEFFTMICQKIGKIIILARTRMSKPFAYI